MAFTLCSSGAIARMAGAGVSSVVVSSGALLTQFSEDAESLINVASRYDFVTNYPTITSAVDKLFLNRLCAKLAAMDAVDYDTSNYTSAAEAQLKMDYLDMVSRRDLEILEQDITKTYLGVA